MRPLPFRALRALVPILALVLASEALGAAEVYKARHRPAEELLPLAESALAGRGSAALDPATNSLVLVAAPEVLAEAIALLERQDRPLPSVVLRYESRRRADLEAEGIRILWSVGGGSVRVGNVALPGGETGVAVRPEAARGEAAGELHGTLRIVPGRTGRIATGSLVPVHVGHAGYETHVLVAAESGLEVEARILGDGRVQLELFPFESQPQPDGSIQRTSAATTLVVEPGRTVAVGGIRRSSEASGREALSGAGRARASEERVLLVRVEVE